LMAFYLKEAPRFGNAAACCQLALRDFDSDQIRDKKMRAKVESLKSLMEIGAGTMTYDQRVVFGTTVDEVADWFVKEHWLSRPPEPAKPAGKLKKAKVVGKKPARPKPARAAKKPAAKRRK